MGTQAAVHFFSTTPRRYLPINLQWRADCIPNADLFRLLRLAASWHPSST